MKSDAYVSRGTCRAPGCDEPVYQPRGRGRPRLYCSTRCRQRAFLAREHVCPRCKRVKPEAVAGASA